MNQLAKKIEIMEETYDIQLKQNDLLLQRLDNLSKAYNEKLKENTDILRDQYKTAFHDYIKQQTRKQGELQEICNEQKQENTIIKDKFQRIISDLKIQHHAELKEQEQKMNQEFEKIRIEDNNKLKEQLDLNLKNNVSIQLLKQQIEDQRVEHSARVVQVKKYEDTVKIQNGTISSLNRKIQEQAGKIETLEKKLAVLNERLSTLNIPEDFIEKEKQMTLQLNALTKQVEMAERTVENWKQKYQILETTSRRSMRRRN
jgi:uncharacterized coiled-coil protein SlyX